MDLFVSIHVRVQVATNASMLPSTSNIATPLCLCFVITTSVLI